ncbi:esterase [Rhizobium calliandrae]|uniref:Esterase n=1 Tax=Rhizobium calliandrae TaxID=1312182 RepID=A0ABT7KAV1_9HYPH|nr:esterase [Rhizobium calliandrae]MDL2405749.1 esterase [Rhizobium calliandrae]
MPDLSGFCFVAGREYFSSPPLVLLHGSGRGEAELIALADEVAPQRPYMALRGGVDWDEGFAFFRRNPDRSLDYADLREQTDRICRFIGAAVEQGVLRQPPILLGFSNGAIMAASILHTEPGLASGAILLRPLSPAPGKAFPPMPGLPVLITAGKNDERRQPEDAVLIKTQFENCQADVSSHVLPTGHGLHESEARLIRDWIIQKGI